MMNDIRLAARRRWSGVVGLLVLVIASPAVDADDPGSARLSVAAAQRSEMGWPTSWYAPPRSASESGVTSFSQSPYLDNRGLPPVKERLPDDPIVIDAYESNGRYGGNAVITLGDSWQFFNWESALTISADMRTLLPNLAHSWEVSADGKVTTIHLRSGIKWSDGHPLTSDDFLFTFNHIWLDKEYSPVTSRLVLGGKIEKIDDLNFRYVFREPNPLFVFLIAQYGNFLVDPEHHFAQFHPSYADPDTVNEIIREKGFISWMAYIDNLRMARIEDAAETPTLRAFQVISRTPTMMKYARNPYYPKIDSEGRQLPYVDTIDAQVIVDNSALVTAMASSGQLDFAAYALRTQDIPILKLGERNGLVDVHIWTRVHASDVAIQPNYNFPDAKLRALYWDKRFRRALSYAINRREMNEIIYFDRGVPRQVSAHPTSSYYEEAFALAHSQYDPALSRQLLAQIGLRDADGDGLLEYGDGTDLTITLEFLDFETPKAISLELVIDYWHEIGLDVRLKMVDRALQSARAQANKMQMTVWHADRVTDILFPLIPDWFAPRSTGWDRSLWNNWARYYQTDGELGEEPPQILKDVLRSTDLMRTTMIDSERKAAARHVLGTAAENIWTMGTVGLAPHPVVVSKRLKNVVPNGIWGWDNRWTLSYHPATWYLDGP